MSEAGRIRQTRYSSITTSVFGEPGLSVHLSEGVGPGDGRVAFPGILGSRRTPFLRDLELSIVAEVILPVSSTQEGCTEM